MSMKVENGQIWQEVDPRHERHVRMLNVSADKEIVTADAIVDRAMTPYGPHRCWWPKRGGGEILLTWEHTIEAIDHACGWR